MGKMHIKIPIGIVSVLIMFISARLTYRSFHAMLYEIGFEDNEIWVNEVNIISHLIIILILLTTLIILTYKSGKSSILFRLPPLYLVGTEMLFIAFTVIYLFQDTMIWLGGGSDFLYTPLNYVFNFAFISVLCLMLFGIGKEYWRDLARNIF